MRKREWCWAVVKRESGTPRGCAPIAAWRQMQKSGRSTVGGERASRWWCTQRVLLQRPVPSVALQCEQG